MEPKKDTQARIQEIAKMLPPEKLREVIDFMEFLYQKEKKFAYTSVKNSAEYVRSLREKESVTQKGQQMLSPLNRLKSLVNGSER